MVDSAEFLDGIVVLWLLATELWIGVLSDHCWIGR